MRLKTKCTDHHFKCISGGYINNDNELVIEYDYNYASPVVLTLDDNDTDYINECFCGNIVAQFKNRFIRKLVTFLLTRYANYGISSYN